MVDVLAELKTISALLRDRPVENVVRVGELVTFTDSPEPKQRRSPAKEKVRDYIAKHPESKELSANALAKLIGVDKNTVITVRNEL